MTDRPLFSFIHVTDTHLSEEVDVVSPFVDAINSRKHHELPDFVVFGGDNINGNRTDGSFCELETPMLKERLDALDVPYYITCHGHDTWGEECRGTQYRKHFGDDAISYVRDFPGGFRGIFVSGAFHEDERLVEIHDQIDWLDRELSKARGERVLLFAHAPLLPARKPVPDSRVADLVDPRWQASRFCYKPEFSDPLRALIKRHGNVLAYYAGHCHVNSVRESDGTWYITTGALATRPGEYRYVRAYRDRLVHICVRPHGIRKMKLSRIKEAEEKGLSVETIVQRGDFWINCVDEDHPTVESYHDGLPNEREFEIPY